MNEKFCLKWNDFQENTIKSFSNLRKEEDFYDVTLVPDDQKQIMAHKVVLSSSSEYFKNILKKNKHSHPMICLTGISSAELENVLDYIYQGEVQIFQENIDKFLNLAQRFHIEGLLSSEIETNENKISNLSMDTKFEYEPNQNYEKLNEAVNDRDSVNMPEYTISLNDNSSVEEIEQKVTENLGKNDNGDYTCNLCGKVGGKNIRNMKNHIETHLEGISFSCSVCGKQFRSRNAQNLHMSRNHRMSR